MKTTAERVKEILVAGFPHWSQWDVDGLTPFLMAFFKEQTKKDPSYVVAATSELYSYFEEKVVGRGKIEKRDVGPGLIVHHLKRFTKESERFKSLYKNKRTYKLQIQNLEDNINAVNEIESAFSSHNNFESLDAIRAYMKEIDSIVTFSRKQMPAWAIMREVSEQLVQGATLGVFWLEVKARCIEDGIVIKDKDDQWRQMKKRILDRINAKARGSEGMLQMVSVSAEELALRKLLNVVAKLEEQSQNFTNTDLEQQDMVEYQENSKEKAYQFSEMELHSLMNLRKLFSRNQYTTDRFPEVYDGDIPARSKEEQKLIDLGSDGIFELVKKSWIDALGIYRFGPHKNQDYNYEFTAEGIIIIDSKKIEQWVDIWNQNSSEELTVDDVRFVVLMHELGHWLSHWASRKDKKDKDADLLQWNPGFEFPNILTKEALANIICLWACEDIADEEQRIGVLTALNALTPKNENGDVDTSNAYGAYKLIEGFERSDVLEKLNAVRANWMLKDEFLFDFLKSSEKDVLKWLGERQPEIVSIEDYASNPQLEHKSVWSQGGASIIRRSGILPKRPN
jgi:hypothetical protein